MKQLKRKRWTEAHDVLFNIGFMWTLFAAVIFFQLGAPLHEFVHYLDIKASGGQVVGYCLYGFKQYPDGTAALGWVAAVGGYSSEAKAYALEWLFYFEVWIAVWWYTHRQVGRLMRPKYALIELVKGDRLVGKERRRRE